MHSISDDRQTKFDPGMDQRSACGVSWDFWYVAICMQPIQTNIFFSVFSMSFHAGVEHIDFKLIIGHDVGSVSYTEAH